jgi:hypothetical protein
MTDYETRRDAVTVYGQAAGIFFSPFDLQTMRGRGRWWWRRRRKNRKKRRKRMTSFKKLVKIILCMVISVAFETARSGFSGFPADSG